jgi:hypothetical protein
MEMDSNNLEMETMDQTEDSTNSNRDMADLVLSTEMEMLCLHHRKLVHLSHVYQSSWVHQVVLFNLFKIQMISVRAGSRDSAEVDSLEVHRTTGPGNTGKQQPGQLVGRLYENSSDEINICSNFKIVIIGNHVLPIWMSGVLWNKWMLAFTWSRYSHLEAVNLDMMSLSYWILKVDSTGGYRIVLFNCSRYNICCINLVYGSLLIWYDQDDVTVLLPSRSAEDG